MRYVQYGPMHELRMWLQLFTHWSFLVTLAFAGFVAWLITRIGRAK